MQVVATFFNNIFFCNRAVLYYRCGQYKCKDKENVCNIIVNIVNNCYSYVAPRSTCVIQERWGVSVAAYIG